MEIILLTSGRYWERLLWKRRTDWELKDDFIIEFGDDDCNSDDEEELIDKDRRIIDDALHQMMETESTICTNPRYDFIDTLQNLDPDFCDGFAIVVHWHMYACAL